MANDPINLYDYEARAKLAMPHDNWDFVDAGAMECQPHADRTLVLVGGRAILFLARLGAERSPVCGMDSRFRATSHTTANENVSLFR